MTKFFVLFFFFVLSRLPRVFYSFFLAPLLFFFSKKSKDFYFLQKNISNHLHLSEGSKDSYKFIKENCLHFCLSFYEILQFVSCRRKLVFEGQKNFECLIKKAEDEGEGSYILITAHLGAWDLLGHSCAVASKNDFFALAKPSRSSFFSEFLDLFRVKLGMKILWTRKDNFQRSLLHALKEGGSVGFLMDQKPLKREGIEVIFLGKKTPFVKGPAFLAKKFHKPVLMAYCVRKNDFSYELFCDFIPKNDIQNLSLEELTQIFADSISKKIYDYPQQWVWSYKRWSYEKKGKS